MSVRKGRQAKITRQLSAARRLARNLPPPRFGYDAAVSALRNTVRNLQANGVEMRNDIVLKQYT